MRFIVLALMLYLAFELGYLQGMSAIIDLYEASFND